MEVSVSVPIMCLTDQFGPICLNTALMRTFVDNKKGHPKVTLIKLKCAAKETNKIR